MDRRVFDNKKRTGKKWVAAGFCLFFLFGMIGTVVLTLRGGFGRQGNFTEIENAKAENSRTFRVAGGFHNPIDDRYMSLLYENEDDTVGRQKLMVEYEAAWKQQLEDYLADYRSRCSYQSDKEMVDEYQAAVEAAVDAQKKLMEYRKAEKEQIGWYSVQTYRCAFVKCIRGNFEAQSGIGSNRWKKELPADAVYEKWGEFDNDIDRQFVLSMYEGCEAEIRTRQEEFDIAWSNELCESTIQLYETLDEEGKQIVNAWQASREQWKEAFNNRFWWTPEELNSAGEEDSLWRNGTASGIMEVHGWINRLYCLQIYESNCKS